MYCNSPIWFHVLISGSGCDPLQGFLSIWGTVNRTRPCCVVSGSFSGLMVDMTLTVASPSSVNLIDCDTKVLLLLLLLRCSSSITVKEPQTVSMSINQSKFI